MFLTKVFLRKYSCDSSP